jgi:hypothetical protein
MTACDPYRPLAYETNVRISWLPFKGRLLAIALCLCACDTPNSEEESLFLTVSDVYQEVTRAGDKIYVHISGHLRRDQHDEYVLLDIDEAGTVIESGPALRIRIQDAEVSRVIANCERENVGVMGHVVFDESPVLLATDIDELSDVLRFVVGTCE